MYYHDPRVFNPWQIHPIPYYNYPQMPSNVPYWNMMTTPQVPCALQSMHWTPWHNYWTHQQMINPVVNNPVTYPPNVPFVPTMFGMRNPMDNVQANPNINQQTGQTQEITTDKNTARTTQENPNVYQVPCVQTHYVQAPYVATPFVQTTNVPPQQMLTNQVPVSTPTVVNTPWAPFHVAHPNFWIPWNMQVGYYYPICR